MPIISRTYTRLTIPVFMILAISFSKLQAQDLQLMPMRVVFEGAQKVEELSIINTGKDTAIYNVSVVQYRMNESGAFERITEPDPGQFFADQNIRVFPRRVTLVPGEAQVVKVQVTKTSQLAPGEYRSHLYFRAAPNEKPLGGKENKIAVTGGISMKLTPVFGITIPVIIRVGESTAQVKITELSLKDEDFLTQKLHLKFNRTGNMSVYGDLVVNHISTQGKKTQVGLVKGIAVYTPGTVRNFQIELQEQPGVDLQSGKLIASYKAQKDSRTLAESELILRPISVVSSD